MKGIAILVPPQEVQEIVTQLTLTEYLEEVFAYLTRDTGNATVKPRKKRSPDGN